MIHEDPRNKPKSQKAQVHVEFTVHCTVRYNELPSDWSEKQIKAQAREDALTGLPQHSFVSGVHETDLWYESGEHEVVLCEIEEPDF